MGDQVRQRCMNCGSEEVVGPVSLMDSGSGYPAPSHTIGVALNPQAVVFKDVLQADVQGVVCATCGYIALFAHNPARFAYFVRQSQREQAEREAKAPKRR
jgi:hypothetical protein